MNRITIIATSLLFTFFWGAFFLLPKTKELNSLKEEIRQKQNELQSKEKYLAELNQISQNLKNYEVQLSKIDAALPDTPELPALFDFLQKSASQSGLVLKGLETTFQSQEEKLGEIRETRLNLFLVGSYSSFKNFLPTLEKSSRLIEVESITLFSPETPPASFKLRIKVNSY